MFNLHQRKVIYVTNNGRNIVNAYNLAKADRIRCVAHALHNLIMHGGCHCKNSFCKRCCASVQRHCKDIHLQNVLVRPQINAFGKLQLIDVL